jgi:tetratricopeptide (TPR) repeat protein
VRAAGLQTDEDSVITLIIYHDGEIESEMPVAGMVRIGRDSQNDLVLDDPSKGVSRFHAEIHDAGGVFTIADLNSRNGIWVDGKRVQRATLANGVAVRLGAYELVVEDRPPTESFTLAGPGPHPNTIVAKPSQPAQGPSRSGTRAADLRAAQSSKGMLWLIVGVVVIAIVGVAFAIARSRQTHQKAEVVGPAALPPTPIDHGLPPDPIATAIAAARRELGANNAQAAIDILKPLLDANPDNDDLKKAYADANDLLVRNTPPATTVDQPVVRLPREPKKNVEVVNPADVADITRLPGEDAITWQARGRRAHQNYDTGRTHLAKREYNEAIGAFQQVLRDQPGFTDAESRLSEAQAGKAGALREALDNAAQGEKSSTPSGLFSALRWYEKAYSLDQSPETQGHIKATREKLTKEANQQYERAKVYQSLGEKGKARDLLQNVVNWLPDDDPNRADALKRLEALK